MTRNLILSDAQYTQVAAGFKTEPNPHFREQLHCLLLKDGVFRWIAAGTLTDANGTFALNDLTEGQYVLVCALPPGIHLLLPQDASLHIGNAPPTFSLNYASPTADLGAIQLSISGASIQR